MLSPEQYAQFQRDGYIVVENLLTDAEADAFASYENEPGKPEGWRQNLRNHAQDEKWRHIAMHPNVAEIAEQILDGTPAIVQSMYLEKKPAGPNVNKGGTGTAMHQDLHYLPCEPESLLACWIAISDTDAENGGLCVVPGSNHDPIHGTHRTENTDDHDSWEIEYLMRDKSGKEWTERMYSFEIDGLDHSKIKCLTVPKGAGVFFDGRTIHGSFGNRTEDRVRRAFATHYSKAGTWMFRDDVQQLVEVA
ncbi:MAG: phytanoyl-CoA dioxygenase family protein [Bacteroidota bacterium]